MGVDSAMEVAGLVARLGRVRGRKHLQKIVHLLQDRGATRFQYRFILYHFGPFSRDLASDLDFLRSLELVEEQPPSPPAACYVYSAPEKPISDQILELCDQTTSGEGWVELAESLNGLETPLLESLSTIVFLARRNHGGERLREEFKRVKPHLAGQFDTAVERGKELGFSVLQGST